MIAASAASTGWPPPPGPKTVEFDAKEVNEKLDRMRSEHREEVKSLRRVMDNTESAPQAFMKAAADTAALNEQVEALNAALANAKKDHQAVVGELEAVNQRFDEATREAEKRGRESVLRPELIAEKEAEVEGLKSQLKELAADNVALQQRVDNADLSMAVEKDSKAKNVEGAKVQSEMVKQLQAQLTRSREEVSKKENEMDAIVSKLEERVAQAEGGVMKLEKELSLTKGKLAEAEAHLIVTRREKELADSKDIAKKIPKKAGRVPRTPSSEYMYHPDIADMEGKLKVSRRRRVRSNSPNRYKRLELRLREQIKKEKELQKEHELLKEQKRMGQNHVKRLEDDLKVLQKQLFASGETGVSTQMSRLSKMGGGAAASGSLDEDGKSKVAQVIESNDPAQMKEELVSLEKKCNSQRDYNNQLLSKMLQLQGNIQVFCRIRPVSVKEIKQGCKTTVEALSESELGCFDSRTNQWKSFAFDRVWGTDQSQQEIFQDVEPIALSVVDGFNACIFAYGQT